MAKLEGSSDAEANAIPCAQHDAVSTATEPRERWTHWRKEKKEEGKAGGLGAEGCCKRGDEDRLDEAAQRAEHAAHYKEDLHLPPPHAREASPR